MFGSSVCCTVTSMLNCFIAFVLSSCNSEESMGHILVLCRLIAAFCNLSVHLSACDDHECHVAKPTL
jgi:hypothetical protein